MNQFHFLFIWSKLDFESVEISSWHITLEECPSLLLNTSCWLRLLRRYDHCPKLKVKQGFQHIGNSKCANMKVTTPITKYSVCLFRKSPHMYIWVLRLKWVWLPKHESKCWIWHKKSSSELQVLNGRT